MRSAVLLTLAALLACVLLFGRSFTGGHFLVDPTFAMDVYHLSLLYERLGVHLTAGHYPFFFPEFGGGYPVAAAWMYGLYYPPVLINALLSPDLAWTLSATLHLVLAAIGMFVFLRRPLGSDAAAATAGLLYAFSEYLAGRVFAGHLNLVWAAAWVPWVLWSAGRCVRGERAGTLLFGLLLGIGLLAGHIQVWFYVAPLVAIYAHLEAGPGRERLRALLRFGGGVALAVAITTVQWSATLEFLHTAGSPDLSGMPLRELEAPPHVLAAKVFPGFLGHLPATFFGGGLFVHESYAIGGLAVLFLVMLGIVSARRGRNLWLGAALFGLILSLGESTALSNWLNDLPVLRAGRTAGRALHLTVLGVSVLAGHGVAGWLASGARLTRRRVLTASLGTLLVALAALVGLGLWMRGAVDPAEVRERISGTCLPAVLSSLGALLLLVAALFLVRRLPRWAGVLPLAVLAGTLMSALPPAETTPSDFYFHDWARTFSAEEREHRIFVFKERFPNLERQGVRTLRLMSSGDVAWYLDLVKAADPELLYWLDVGLTVDAIDRETLLSGGPWPPPEVMIRHRASGRGVLFSDAHAGPSDSVVMRALSGGARTLFLMDGADTRLDDGPSPAGAAPAGEVRYVPGPNPNRVEFEVSTPRAAWLYVGEKFYPQWTSNVDGDPATVHRSNVAGLAVAVPAGSHRVELEFSTVSATVGVAVSLISLAVCVAALVPALRRRPRAIREV